jgi:hypothetical protein
VFAFPADADLNFAPSPSRVGAMLMDRVGGREGASAVAPGGQLLQCSSCRILEWSTFVCFLLVD